MSDDELKIDNISNKLKNLVSCYILREIVKNDTIRSLKDDKVEINISNLLNIIEIFKPSLLMFSK